MINAMSEYAAEQITRLVMNGHTVTIAPASMDFEIATGRERVTNVRIVIGASNITVDGDGLTIDAALVDASRKLRALLDRMGPAGGA